MRKRLNEELGRKTVREFADSEKLPLSIILDNVRSHNNTGSVFRTADAFLVERILLCGITPTPPHRDIQKTALGATESVEWKYYSKTVDAVTELKRHGYVIVAVEQVEGAYELQDFTTEKGGKYALIFGHEIHGVSQDIVNMCDHCIEIPQFGTKHSFNIAVSAGIVLWEISRKLRYKESTTPSRSFDRSRG
ncbi:MAG: RNA methyltransferase [Bacteroidales bacterium]|jgi:tRNA G18 (ribose-2'-O)-methylase SpoU